MLYLVGLTKGNTYHITLTPLSASTIDLSIVEVVVEQPTEPEPSEPEVNPDDNKGEEVEPSEPEQPEPSEPEVNPDDNKGEEVEPTEPDQPEPSEPEVNPDDNKGEEVEPTEPDQPEPSEPEVNPDDNKGEEVEPIEPEQPETPEVTPDDNKGEEVEPTEPEQPEPSEPEVNPDDNKGEEVEPSEPEQPTEPETPEVTPDQPEPTFPLTENAVAHFINYSSTEPSHDFGMTISDGIYSCDFVAGSTNQTLSLLEGKTRYLFQLSDDDRTIPLTLNNITIAAEDTLDGLNMLYLVGLTKGNTYHLVLAPLSATTIDLSIVEVVVEQPDQPEPSEPEVNPDDNKGEEVEPTEPEPSEPETPDQPTDSETPETPEVTPEQPDQPTDPVTPEEPDQPTDPETPEVTPEVTPEQPDQPTEPETPETPEVTPEEPDQPTEPETPEVTPEEPDQPEPTFPLSESTVAHFINYSSTEPSHDFGMTISDGIYSCDFVAGSTNQTFSLLEGKTRYLFQLSDDDRTIPLSLSNITIAAEDTLDGLNMLYLVGLTKGNTYHLVLSPLSATTIDLSITEVVVEQPDQPEVTPDDNKGEEVEPTEPEQPEPSEPEVNPDDNKGEEVEPSEPEQPEPSEPEVNPDDNKGEEVEPTEPEQPEPSEPEVNPDDNKGEEVEPTEPEQPEPSEPEVAPDDNKGEEIEPTEPEQPTEPETPEVTPEPTEPDQPESTFPLSESTLAHFINYSSTESSHDFEMTIADGIYSCDFVAGRTNQTLSLLEGKTRYLFQLSDDDRTIPLSLNSVTIAAEDTLDGLNMLYLVGLTKGESYRLTITPVGGAQADIAISELGNHSAISDITDDANSTRTIYTLSGIKVTDTDHLKPGVYIEIIAGQAPRKIFIH
jgi:hypothetical protein